MDIFCGSLVILLLIGGLLGVAWILDRSAKNRGNLFTGKPTVGMRILAFILGSLLTGFVALEIVSMTRWHPIIGMIGILLILYAVGADRALRSIQGEKSEPASKQPSINVETEDQ
jgi:hypothetical protein